MHLVNLYRLVGRCESGRLQRGTKHHCSVVCVPVERKRQENVISRLKNGFLSDLQQKPQLPHLCFKYFSNKFNLVSQISYMNLGWLMGSGGNSLF